MELRQIRYFLTIYEEGSLTRASRRLNVVQPALSQQLLKLENELGRSLFSRAHSGMIPTADGDEAYDLFSSVVGNLDTAVQTLSGERDAIRGTVSIGVVASVANNALSETLRQFTARYPQVRIRATGGYTTELREMLRRAQLDVIIINVPMHLRDPAVVDIGTEDLCLIGAPKAIEDLPSPFPLRRVNELKLVVPSERHGLRLIIDRAAEETNVSLDPHMEFDELPVIEHFVVTSTYFTILPPIAVFRALRSGSLRALPITPRIPRRLVHMVNPSRPLSAAGQALIDEIRDNAIEYAFDVQTSLESLDALARHNDPQ